MRAIHALKKFWQRLGPGFITGSSDDDPSGVATYAASGAAFGFGLLWMSWVTIPLMIAVQEMSARVGLVTGRGLIASVKNKIPVPLVHLSVLLLFFANSINIGADIGAMADAITMLDGRLRFGAVAIALTICCALLQVFVRYKFYVRYLKWLTLSLLSYIAVSFYIELPVREILFETFLPAITFNRDTMLMITAILGTTISPYLLFWQASEEVEEEVALGRQTVAQRRGVTKHEMADMRFDVSFGMIFSNVVMFFIIMTTAATLFGSGVVINTAADAARALQPLAGEYAGVLFALGIIGVGLLAVPILAGSASYAVCELFGWKSGLYRGWRSAPEFYAVIAIGTLLGLCVNFFGVSPMKALLWTAVLNGCVAPFTIMLLLIAGNDKKIMGIQVNSAISNIGGVLACVLLVGSILLYALL